jgi:Membrane dipeptidase (Peptidase family M19)
MSPHRLLTPHALVAAAWLAMFSSSTFAQTFSVAESEDALVKKARAIHERVVTLDTHNDISPANFTPERNYTQRIDTQVNLPKMFEGGLDASFFIVYIGQTTEAQNPDAFKPAGYERAYKAAIEKFDAIHRLTEQIAPDKIELALTSADVRRIAATGKKVALIGRKRVSARRRSRPRQRILEPRRALYVARAQRRQSVLRLEYRRTRRLQVGQRHLAARKAGHRGGEPARHHGGRLSSV